MLWSELDRIEKRERPDDREERRLIPVDSYSQLDTGFTGRSDCDCENSDSEWARKNNLNPRRIARLLRD